MSTTGAPNVEDMGERRTRPVLVSQRWHAGCRGSCSFCLGTTYNVIMTLVTRRLQLAEFRGATDVSFMEPASLSSVVVYLKTSKKSI